MAAWRSVILCVCSFCTAHGGQHRARGEPKAGCPRDARRGGAAGQAGEDTEPLRRAAARSEEGMAAAALSCSRHPMPASFMGLTVLQDVVQQRIYMARSN